MSNPSDRTTPAEPEGMGPQAALRLEYAIIALGIVALILIFQPFSVTLFAIGSGLVVLAGLINNLLPLAQPGVKARSVVTIAMVVAMIFGIVLLVSIAGRLSLWRHAADPARSEHRGRQGHGCSAEILGAWLHAIRRRGDCRTGIDHLVAQPLCALGAVPHYARGRSDHRHLRHQGG